MLTRMEKDRMLKWVERMYAREIEKEDKDTVDSDYYLVEHIVKLIEADDENTKRN